MAFPRPAPVGASPAGQYSGALAPGATYNERLNNGLWRGLWAERRLAVPEGTRHHGMPRSLTADIRTLWLSVRMGYYVPKATTAQLAQAQSRQTPQAVRGAARPRLPWQGV
jgi:hypothetical protein